MAHDPDPEPLSPELVASLRSLGGERAPADLGARVELARMEPARAPRELWERVAAELRFGEAAPRRGRLIAWPRWAAAAAVLAAAGVAWLAGADLLGPRTSDRYVEAGLAPEVPDDVRRELIAGLAVREVSPAELSSLTRAFLAGAAPAKEGG